jgi:hypothetical protein
VGEGVIRRPPPPRGRASDTPVVLEILDWHRDDLLGQLKFENA